MATAPVQHPKLETPRPFMTPNSVPTPAKSPVPLSVAPASNPSGAASPLIAAAAQPETNANSRSGSPSSAPSPGEALRNPYRFPEPLLALLNLKKLRFDDSEQTALAAFIREQSDGHAKNQMVLGAAVDLLERRCLAKKSKSEKGLYYEETLSISYSAAMRARRTYRRFRDVPDEYKVYGATRAAILAVVEEPEMRMEIWNRARGVDDKPRLAKLEQAIREARKEQTVEDAESTEVIRLDEITAPTPLGNCCELVFIDGKRGLLLLDQPPFAKGMRRLAKLAASLSGARVVFGPAPKA